MLKRFAHRKPQKPKTLQVIIAAWQVRMMSFVRVVQEVTRSKGYNTVVAQERVTTESRRVDDPEISISDVSASGGAGACHVSTSFD